ncbi:MAG: hypothetical protein AB7G38_10525 [Dehalococcoidia bacterium]
MIDITIIGGGSAARACTDLLTAAGFGLRRTFAFDDEDRSPIILGELPAALNVARQAVEAGRHLMIANPSQLSPERLGLLFEGRRRAQALFLWSTRRFHPSYRFVSSLIESDATWQPRHLRHETLIAEPPSVSLANWSLIETAALVTGLAGNVPRSVTASGAANPMRNANELMNLTIEFPNLRAFILLGLGEAVERRETLIAGQRRRLFIDELNQSVPVRLISDDADGESTPTARWLSTSAPSADELARQQCLAFLDSTLHPSQTQDEANLWTQAFAITVAARQSLLNNGAAAPVEQRESEAPKFRILPQFAS